MQCIKLSDLTKFIMSNLISFNRTKKLKISKLDLDNNVSILKTNKYVFKNVFIYIKYKKIFGFGLNYFIVQINVIKHYKLFFLYLSGIYVKII